MNFNSSTIKSALVSIIISSSLHSNSQSPTQPALGFNVFLENNATLSTNETEGPIALGGDLNIAGNYQIAVQSPGNFTVQGVPIGLLVGGRVNYQSGNQLQINNNAYIKIGDGTGSVVWYFDQNNAASPIRITPNSNYNSTPRIMLQANAPQLGVSSSNNPVIQGGLIDFTSAFNTMRNSSLSISKCTNNATLTNPNGQPISNTNLPNQVKIILQDGINYLNVSGADLNNVSVFTYENQPNSNRVLVVNVDAPGTFNWNVWNQAGIGFNQCPFVIYNFYNTTQLNIVGSSTVMGTIFAPFANIQKVVNQSNIQGQVIGKSFHHAGGEVHYAQFLPSIPGCSVVPPIFTGTAPTASFNVNSNAQCLNGNSFVFENSSSVIGCPNPFAFESYPDALTAQNQFNSMFFSAEGRSGNNTLNGTFELDIHNISPYQILSEAQFIWPNNQYVPFSIVFNPNASGNDRFIYTIGTPNVGAGQRILKLDPVAAGYPMNDINGIWLYSRNPANTTLLISNLEIDGTPVGQDFGGINPTTTHFENIVFRGATFEDGFVITGNVKFAWSGPIPQNSALNFNFKIGNIDCVPTNIIQPNDTLTYLWDFGNNTTSTLENPTVSYTQPGIYTVTLTASNNFGSSTANITVTVFENPTLTLQTDTIASGQGSLDLQLTITDFNPDFVYIWTLPDGSNSNAQNVTLSFDSAGFYTYTIWIVDTNNCSALFNFSIAVETDDVNTGNDGGIESESLGDLVAKRYLQKKKENIPTTFDKTTAPKFIKSELTSAVRSSNQAMIDMFPTELVQGGESFISSPTDILNFTIAKEVLSVDYTINGETKAVVLGIKTANRVYNHTKATCDRLREAEILDITPVEINGHKFLAHVLKQRNGVIEHAVTFSVGKNNTESYYSIQSNWNINEYTPSDTVYNFQVWSTLPQYTEKLVSDIIHNLQSFIPTIQTEVQRVPDTYASKVVRQGQNLVIDIKSTLNNKPAELINEVLKTETEDYTLRYNAFGTTSFQKINLNIADDYEYNGVIKTLGTKQDAYYHADGNWGLDFDPQFTSVESFQVLNDEQRVYNNNERHVYRNVELKAFSDDDYITLYKSLLPGNLSDDYSAYNYISFKAKGSGILELVLIKASVQNWENQYKVNFTLSENEQTYFIPFTSFTSTGTLDNLVADDLGMLAFTFIPEFAGTKNLDLSVSEVKFTKEALNNIEFTKTLKESLLVYPNPSKGNVRCVLHSNQSGPADVELKDLSGRLVFSQKVNLVQGRNELDFNFDEKIKRNKILLMNIKDKNCNFGTVKLIFE